MNFDQLPWPFSNSIFNFLASVFVWETGYFVRYFEGARSQGKPNSLAGWNIDFVPIVNVSSYLGLGEYLPDAFSWSLINDVENLLLCKSRLAYQHSFWKVLVWFLCYEWSMLHVRSLQLSRTLAKIEKMNTA